MKKNMRWIALAVLALTGAAAQAQDSGDWIVRARALYMDPANKDSTGLDLNVNEKLFPEVDISYFFTPNIAAELILTYPQKHDIRSGGTKIGSLKHLPPTLTAQYHFTGFTGFTGWRPYLGAGVNYTRLMSVNFDDGVDAALEPSVKKNSFGWALQAGFDVPIGGGWLFNVDVKKLQIRTDVSSFGSKVGTLKVDPVLFSVGVGKRF